MAFGQRWLVALSPFVREQLPAPPTRVIELGCGPLGGFVPALLAAGYDAIGVDRNAPAGDAYRQGDFERTHLGEPAGAIIANRSLHHVGDVGEVLDRVTASLALGGLVIVAEWAWEQFDEQTARWCFERLGEAEGEDAGWLRRRRADWRTSGEAWDAYFPAWAAGHGLHRAEHILAALDCRFERVLVERGPYFHADLASVSEPDEQAAIEAREVRATGVRYVGLLGA